MIIPWKKSEYLFKNTHFFITYFRADSWILHNGVHFSICVSFCFSGRREDHLHQSKLGISLLHGVPKVAVYHTALTVWLTCLIVCIIFLRLPAHTFSRFYDKQNPTIFFILITYLLYYIWTFSNFLSITHL